MAHGWNDLLDEVSGAETEGRGVFMKKVLQVICCAVGSGMIGFFANQLDTVVGCVCFTLGIAMLVASIIIISKNDNTDD